MVYDTQATRVLMGFKYQFITGEVPIIYSYLRIINHRKIGVI